MGALMHFVHSYICSHASLSSNDTTHCLVQCRVSLCSHVMPCEPFALVLLHMLLYIYFILLYLLYISTSVYLLQHPYNVLCLAIACVFDAICLPTFLQRDQDCFLLACGLGHQEIVRELLTRDKVDRNVVDKVRNEPVLCLSLSTVSYVVSHTCRMVAVPYIWHVKVVTVNLFRCL